MPQTSPKLIAVCGSPRKDGNTQILMERFCDRVRVGGIDAELVLLCDKTVKPCTGCRKCKETKDNTCVIKDDDFHPIYKKILDAQALVVGSPVYFGMATSQITSLLHKVGYVARANGNLLSGKVGGSIVVARRAGHNFTFGQLNYFFGINEMILPGSTYWNIAFGRQKGEVKEDQEGLETIDRFADNVATLVKKLHMD
jgi:multimeric flavodoxin WrbA